MEDTEQNSVSSAILAKRISSQTEHEEPHPIHQSRPYQIWMSIDCGRRKDPKTENQSQIEEAENQSQIEEAEDQSQEKGIQMNNELANQVQAIYNIVNLEPIVSHDQLEQTIACASINDIANMGLMGFLWFSKHMSWEQEIRLEHIMKYLNMEISFKEYRQFAGRWIEDQDEGEEGALPCVSY
jgi:hypothetical protein